MLEKINNIKNEAIGQIIEARDKKTLEEIRAKFLGRSGKINKLTKEIPSLSLEKRGETGKLINEAKRTIQQALEQALDGLSVRTLKHEWIDITAPGILPPQGNLHLITEAIREISAIFLVAPVAGPWPHSDITCPSTRIGAVILYLN